MTEPSGQPTSMSDTSILQRPSDNCALALSQFSRLALSQSCTVAQPSPQGVKNQWFVMVWPLSRLVVVSV